MEITLSRGEKVLFELLKAALNGSLENNLDWTSVTANEWKSCYAIAVKHGVMAVAWDGMQLLPVEKQAPRALRLTWGLNVQKYEARYEKYCRTAAELSEIYAGNGIAMVQMKGVGLSQYYPVPSHREGGDIDIYTYSSDKSKMSDKEANTLADKLMEDHGIPVEYESDKHSNFFFRNISIENHKVFLNMTSIPIANRMDDLLKEIMNPQETFLCDGKYRIMTPSPEFNAIFLSFHAVQHYCAGIRIHHIFDWACMLKKYGLPMPEEVTDRKYLGFVHALTNICNELLGTGVEVPCDRKFTVEVLKQVMHPRFEDNIPKNKIAIFVYKGLRFLYSQYKMSKIFKKSLLKDIRNSIRFHLRKPETILKA